MTFHPPDTSFMSVSWLAMIWISMDFNLKLKSVLIWHSGLWGVTLVMMIMWQDPGWDQGQGDRIGVNNCHSISLITITKTWELWLDADGLIKILLQLRTLKTKNTKKLCYISMSNCHKSNVLRRGHQLCKTDVVRFNVTFLVRFSSTSVTLHITHSQLFWGLTGTRHLHNLKWKTLKYIWILF